MSPPDATAKPARVLFLADSGPEIGGGHLMRCLTLAGALQAQGAVCAFVARPDAAGVLEAFAGPQVTQLPAMAGDMQSLAQQGVARPGEDHGGRSSPRLEAERWRGARRPCRRGGC